MHFLSRCFRLHSIVNTLKKFFNQIMIQTLFCVSISIIDAMFSSLVCFKYCKDKNKFNIRASTVPSAATAAVSSTMETLWVGVSFSNLTL